MADENAPLETFATPAAAPKTGPDWIDRNIPGFRTDPTVKFVGGLPGRVAGALSEAGGAVKRFLQPPRPEGGFMAEAVRNATVAANQYIERNRPIKRETPAAAVAASRPAPVTGGGGEFRGQGVTGGFGEPEPAPAAAPPVPAAPPPVAAPVAAPAAPAEPTLKERLQKELGAYGPTSPIPAHAPAVAPTLPPRPGEAAQPPEAAAAPAAPVEAPPTPTAAAMPAIEGVTEKPKLGLPEEQRVPTTMAGDKGRWSPEMKAKMDAAEVPAETRFMMGEYGLNPNNYFRPDGTWDQKSASAAAFDAISARMAVSPQQALAEYRSTPEFKQRQREVAGAIEASRGGVGGRRGGRGRATINAAEAMASLDRAAETEMAWAREVDMKNYLQAGLESGKIDERQFKALENQMDRQGRLDLQALVGSQRAQEIDKELQVKRDQLDEERRQFDAKQTQEKELKTLGFTTERDIAFARMRSEEGMTADKIKAEREMLDKKIQGDLTSAREARKGKPFDPRSQEALVAKEQRLAEYLKQTGADQLGTTDAKRQALTQEFLGRWNRGVANSVFDPARNGGTMVDAQGRQFIWGYNRETGQREELPLYE